MLVDGPDCPGKRHRRNDHARPERPVPDPRRLPTRLTTWSATAVAVGTADEVGEVGTAGEVGEVVPFAQCTPEGTAIGCTRFMSLRRWRGREVPDEVEIGGTWLTATAQRTPVNTEAKYLLLRHAFEEWGVWQVELVTDARNARSRAAIERLGATFEGVLRKHRPAADAPATSMHPRNSAVYSIVDDDWPEVERRLRDRLGPSARGA